MSAHRSRYFFIPLLSLFGLGCSTKETWADPSPVASVGNSSIGIESLRARFGDKIKDSLFVYSFLSNWIEKELLYRGGLSQGIDEDVSVLQKISDYKKDLIGAGFLSLSVKEYTIESDAVRKYYTDNRDRYKRKKKEAQVSYFTAPVHSAALKIKGELKKDYVANGSDVLSKYRGTRAVLRYGELPPKINERVFNKRSFKKGNLLGPYLVDNNYYIIKIEKVFLENSYIGIDLVYDEIYQTLKNKALTLKHREIVDSLWLEYPIKVDSQRIRNLIN